VEVAAEVAGPPERGCAAGLATNLKDFITNPISSMRTLLPQPPPPVLAEEKDPNAWDADVQFAENSIIASFFAFMVFRLLRQLNNMWTASFWGAFISATITLGLVFFSWKLLKSNLINLPSPRCEQIFGMASLRLAGLMILCAVAWFVMSQLKFGHVMTDMMVFAVAFTIAVLVSMMLGRFMKSARHKLHTTPKEDRDPTQGKEGQDFGFFVPPPPDENATEKEKSQQNASRKQEPMEISAIGIMLGITIFNLMQDMITAVTGELKVAWIEKNPMCVKGIIALVVCVGSAVVWYYVIHPQSKMSRKQMKQKMLRERSKQQKNPLLKQSEDDPDNDSEDSSDIE